MFSANTGIPLAQTMPGKPNPFMNLVFRAVHSNFFAMPKYPSTNSIPAAGAASFPRQISIAPMWSSSAETKKNNYSKQIVASEDGQRDRTAQPRVLCRSRATKIGVLQIRQNDGLAQCPGSTGEALVVTKAHLFAGAPKAGVVAVESVMKLQQRSVL